MKEAGIKKGDAVAIYLPMVTLRHCHVQAGRSCPRAYWPAGFVVSRPEGASDLLHCPSLASMV